MHLIKTSASRRTKRRLQWWGIELQAKHAKISVMCTWNDSVMWLEPHVAVRGVYVTAAEIFATLTNSVKLHVFPKLAIRKFHDDWERGRSQTAGKKDSNASNSGNQTQDETEIDEKSANLQKTENFTKNYKLFSFSFHFLFSTGTYPVSRKLLIQDAP